jgi:hypothetical protein
MVLTTGQMVIFTEVRIAQSETNRETSRETNDRYGH